MREHDYHAHDDDAPWEGVRLTKEGIRSRAILIFYSALVSAPFVALVASGGLACGLQAHEVLGISCYNFMFSVLFFFDTLRNAAHECFDQAQAEGMVTCREGIPIIAPTYPHRRLARISFAVGGRGTPKRP